MLPLVIFSQQEKIQSYLNANVVKLEVNTQDVSDWVIESKATSKTTGIINYYIKQKTNGIEIFNALTNIAMKNNEVISIGNRFVQNASQKAVASNPELSVLQALHLAKQALQINDQFNNQILSSESTTSFVISNNGKANKIKAKLVYQRFENQLLLAWYFIIHVPKEHHVWSIKINAINGSVIDQKDKIISCQFDSEHQSIEKEQFYFDKSGFKENRTLLQPEQSSYRVLPYTIESPNHGQRQLISSPSDVVASPFGWHDTDGVEGAEFTITSGNNAYAFEDTNDINAGVSPDGGANLSFDFPYFGTNTAAFNYVDAATTNLFYMNNILHDVFYHYGFDEENGNFQYNNYTNVGDGFDQVFAQSQDGGGLNNANFYTPIDGESAAMQMYLWNRKPGSNIIMVTSPSSITGSYLAFESSFNFDDIRLPIAPAFLTGQLILVDDGQGDTDDACSPLINALQLNGNIALVKRGGCLTNGKLLNIQNSGASAVIIYSNLPGNFVIGGFSNAGITIPVITIKKDVADFLLQQVVANQILIKLSSPVTDFINVDGDFDNLVITHEYGHGISIRLSGGRLNSDCLENNEQMGEGWSDWFGLMMQLKATDSGEQARGIGSFVINQPITDVGIRRYHYSTDMTINPFTFADTNTSAVPHGVGSVWATMLWDLTWSYIDKYGFNPNIYSGNGGNNKVLQLVIDALKLQPCSPSFVEARDAILAADQATTGGQDFCLIWQVFARRGLGINATSGDSFLANDQTEDFGIPNPTITCNLGIDYNQNQNLITVFPNPSNGIVTIKINEYIGKLTYQIVDLKGRIIVEAEDFNFNTEKQINIESLQSGIYLIKLNVNETSFTKKLIIK